MTPVHLGRAHLRWRVVDDAAAFFVQKPPHFDRPRTRPFFRHCMGDVYVHGGSTTTKRRGADGGGSVQAFQVETER